MVDIIKTVIDRLPLVTMTVAALFLYYMYKKNKSRAVEGVANPHEYSHASSYLNVSSMKHDFAKQSSVDLFAPLFIFYLPFLLTGERPLMSLSDIISVDSFRAFSTSVIGRSILSLFGYAFFYQVLQPYVLNETPFF